MSQSVLFLSVNSLVLTQEIQSTPVYSHTRLAAGTIDSGHVIRHVILIPFLTIENMFQK